MILTIAILPTCWASVACETTAECERLLRPGSHCVEGFCTNPFQRGCIRSYLGKDVVPQLRTCNSDDDDVNNHYRTNQNNKNNQVNLELVAELQQQQQQQQQQAALSSGNSNSTTTTAVDDPNEPICTPSVFGYSEIRILSQNWESAMFTAWILQIVLSELFHVPATIESSGPGLALNFYDPKNSFDYGLLGYDWDALERANSYPIQGGTCPKSWRTEPSNDSNNSEWEYKSCAHVIPEVWSGQAASVADLTSRQVLEPPELTGVVGKLGWFVPKFVAQQDPSLAHWLGLAGPANRRKMAETFKVPTTFGQYCAEIVPHNCTEPTLFASRPPVDEAEAGKYFVAGGVFQGYFRFTPDNDCDLNPDTCVGHICDFPCEWDTLITPQTYYLNISVASRGTLPPNNAYTYGELLDIWAAANATRSPLLIYWWYPDPTYQFYLGTDAEMQMVQLPPPQQKCIENRVTPAQRCYTGEDNLAIRRGSPLGSCDSEAHSLMKLIISNLYPYLHGELGDSDSSSSGGYDKQGNPIVSSFDALSSNQSTTTTGSKNGAEFNPVLQSPAYEALRSLSITELQLGDIIEAWEARGVDKWNYDPREAVCEWVVDNLQTLKTWIPRTYPRVVQTDAYNHGNEALYGIALGLGSLSTIMVLATFVLTYVWRKRPLLLIAQVGFLYFLLTGLLLVSLASILGALQPENVTCMMQPWFILLGYSLELVPLIVKVAAIHRMTQAAKRMKRVRLDHRQLYGTVLLVCFVVTILLSVWTAVDPLKRLNEITLHPERINDNGETIVTVTHFCASEKHDDVWRYLSLAWQVVLLLCATVLAYQTRNVRQDLNESHTLGLMIYSHFVFVVLRCITFFLEGVVARSTLQALRSWTFSLDAFVALNIYFTPKMYGLYLYDDEYFKAVMSIQRRAPSVISSVIGSHNRASQLHSSFSRSLHVGQSLVDQDAESDPNSGDTRTARRRRSSKYSSSIHVSMSDEDDKCHDLGNAVKTNGMTDIQESRDEEDDSHNKEKKTTTSGDESKTPRFSLGRTTIGKSIDEERGTVVLPNFSKKESLNSFASNSSDGEDKKRGNNSESKEAAVANNLTSRKNEKEIEKQARVIMSTLHSTQDESLEPQQGQQEEEQQHDEDEKLQTNPLSLFEKRQSGSTAMQGLNGMKLKWLSEQAIVPSPAAPFPPPLQKQSINKGEKNDDSIYATDSSIEEDLLQAVMQDLYNDDKKLTDRHWFF